MPTNRRYKHPPRRHEVIAIDPLQELIARIREIDARFAARLAWAKKHLHPAFPAMLPTLEEFRLGRWLSG